MPVHPPLPFPFPFLPFLLKVTHFYTPLGGCSPCAPTSSIVADYLSRTKLGCELALEGQEVGFETVRDRITRNQGQPEYFGPPKPWVSYCSETTIMLNWMSPVSLGRFGLVE